MNVNLYRWCVRPVLFRFDAERTHRATLRACRALGRSGLARRGLRRLFAFEDARLRTSVAGIEFPNPVGLAAGFDKNGVAPEAIASAGFGSVEIGSVSAHPSEGNRVRPRLFRLPADQGMKVFYGVPSDGAEAVARRLAGVRLGVPLGVSLVETNTGVMADPEHVVQEITQAARAFVSLADYLVLNLNCPNSTGGLSHFDEPRNLKLLLEGLRALERLPGVFLKIRSPRNPGAIDAVLEAIDPFPFVKGMILNTHATPVGLKTPKEILDRLPGSMTGPFNRRAVNDAIRTWYSRIDRRKHVLVGVGGITRPEDAYETMRLGASLVQIYTALVYQGPGLVKSIKEGLCRLLERDGFRSISDAVGVDNREQVAA